MNDIERDELLIELRQDVKWIKEWTVEHKQVHSRYFYYFITTAAACILSWFK